MSEIAEALGEFARGRGHFAAAGVEMRKELDTSRDWGANGRQTSNDE